MQGHGVACRFQRVPCAPADPELLGCHILKSALKQFEKHLGYLERTNIQTRVDTAESLRKQLGIDGGDCFGGSKIQVTD